jgi:hypothetical protein
VTATGRREREHRSAGAEDPPAEMLRFVAMVAHVTFASRMRTRARPDLAAVFDLLSPKIRTAVEKTHSALEASGIRHALGGGLAVGAHGEPRATKDVGFLVGNEAFIIHGGGVVTLHPALPIAIDGVPVDAVPVPDDASFLAEGFERAAVSEGIPVVPIETLVCMKLLALRPRDRRDIEDLVRSGVDARRVRPYVAAHLPDLLEEFDALVAGAEQG